MEKEISVERLVERYRYGHCYAFAMAMTREYGTGIGAIVVDLVKGGRHVVHAYCLNGDLMFDAGGRVDDAHLFETYLDGPYKKRYTNFVLTQFGNEAEFLAAMSLYAQEAGKGLEFDEFRPHLEDLAEKARSHLKYLDEARILASESSGMRP